METHPEQVGIQGARVLNSDFRFEDSSCLSWAAGSFHHGSETGLFSAELSNAEPSSAPPSSLMSESDSSQRFIGGEGLWVVPGFVDAHIHLSRTDRVAGGRSSCSLEERDELVSRNFETVLAAGFTGVRDAGGLCPEWIGKVASGEVSGPFISGSLSIITKDVVDEVGSLPIAVGRALANGASWVKIVATKGLDNPVGSPYGSLFSREDFRIAVGLAEAADARVMVHALGGDAITWAIQSGVHSIEHGVYLTHSQAVMMAAAGVTYVPTVDLYHGLLERLELGELQGSWKARLADIIAVHPASIRLARAAGVEVALGSDYVSDDPAGAQLREFRALHDAGLSAREVLRSATVVGAKLLTGECAPTGTLEEGAPANAVIFSRDPFDADAYTDLTAIVAVVKNGLLFTPDHAKAMLFGAPVGR